MMLLNLVHLCLLTFVSGRLVPEKKCIDEESEEYKEECKDEIIARFQRAIDGHEDTESCSNWSYPSKEWNIICPSYCNGERQSPIDIDISDTFYEIEELKYTNYKLPISSVKIKNNGHSASVSWDTGINIPSISGGGLSSDYTLAGFHFHWGCENTEGSEHTIDGERFAMEMHLVHYKTSYETLEEAVKHGDGLAVLGIMFSIGAVNKALTPITDNLSQISEPGTNTEIAFNLSLADFLPSNNQTVFRYLGSLTTPTCNEAVIWTVFQEHVEFSQGQIDAFRSMKDSHQDPMCNNYREVQPICCRDITTFNVISTKEVIKQYEDSS